MKPSNEEGVGTWDHSSWRLREPQNCCRPLSEPSVMGSWILSNYLLRERMPKLPMSPCLKEKEQNLVVPMLHVLIRKAKADVG